jgi:predicted ATP-dependent protease
VIPSANEIHLMLREEVVNAVEAGQFHIYSAGDVDQALELLTGYSVASIDQCVAARIAELQELVRTFSDSGRDKDGDKQDV